MCLIQVYWRRGEVSMQMPVAHGEGWRVVDDRLQHAGLRWNPLYNHALKSFPYGEWVLDTDAILLEKPVYGFAAGANNYPLGFHSFLDFEDAFSLYRYRRLYHDGRVTVRRVRWASPVAYGIDNASGRLIRGHTVVSRLLFVYPEDVVQTL